MKNLKKIFSVLFVLFFIVFSKLYSQDIQQGEFMIVNQTGENGYQIKVDIYPVGAIFNGNDQYTLKAKYTIPPDKDKIWGVQQYSLSNQTSQNWYVIANFDKTELLNGCQFSLGYGKYRIDFYEFDGIEWSQVNTCDIDFSDANFTGVTTSSYFQKLIINYYNSNTIFFNYIDMNGNNSDLVSIYAVDQWIRVWKQDGTPQQGTLTPSKGNFTDYSEESQYHDYPIDATNPQYGFFKHLSPEEVYLNLKVINHNAFINADKTLNFYDCNFTVDNKTFELKGDINNITSLNIKGQKGKFISGNNATIVFPYQSNLKIEDNASIQSYYTTFKSKNPSYYWYGIQLSNPGDCIIDNCVFNDATPSISSNNNYYRNLSITNNTFNIPPKTVNYLFINGILIASTKSLYIYNNNFIYSTEWSDHKFGIEITNYANSENENNDNPNNTKIDIMDNSFSVGGYYHIKITGTGDNLIPVYIKHNIFNDGGINMQYESVTGGIKDNIINRNNPGEWDNKCIYLYKSSPDLFQNTIQSEISNNLELSVNSCPNLEPLRIDNQYFWNAGKNNFYSGYMNNIFAEDNDIQSNILTNYGKNSFTIGQSSNFHIKSYLNLDCNYDTYETKCNFWIGGINNEPNLLIKGNGGCNITCNWQDPGDCNNDNQIIDRIITDMGYGNFDTALVTQSSTIPPPSNDMALYGTGVKNQKLKNYSSAILNFKNLVNTYPNSKHLESSIFKLYECYVLSDTNHNQSWRNIIFGDLKNYLENKIQQYENNDEFVNVAFDFTLKCKIKIKSYTSAMDGYQLISENSPSETERLMASINYIDVEGLIQGSGGGESERDNKFTDNFDGLNTEQNVKPIKDILLKIYSKSKETKKQKENLELQKSNDISKTKSEIDKKHKFEKVLENRAIENINISNRLTKKERRDRIRNDLLLLTKRELSNNTNKELKSLPINYSLSQNYPNPFNPITRINYSIPKQGLVTLKIYDILGREIKTLVNEVKSPGNYIVDFNGSQYASGIYLYRLVSGNFVSVKRMVLIK